jgi:hypothetical protein
LDLIGKRLDLFLEFLDSLLVPTNQRYDKISRRLGFRRQFDAGIRLAHTSI